MSRFGFSLAVLACLVLSAPAWAIDVLVICTNPAAVSDLTEALSSHPEIDSVDLLDGSEQTPSTAQLSPYDAIFMQSNSNWDDPVTLGDHLAAFVDSGGGLCVDFGNFTPGFQIAGLLLSEGYVPLIGTTAVTGSLELGEFDADHPIMADVTSATTGGYTPASLTPGAESIASWATDEEYYVAMKGAVVALNAYYGDGAPFGGDAGLVAANSVYWAFAWQQQPDIGSINPEEASNDGVVSVEISGDFFIYQNTAVILSGPAQAEIPADDIVVMGYKTIECEFDLTGAAPGDYDLVVTTAAGEETSEKAFTVTELSDDDDDDDTGDDDDDDDNDDNECCGC